MDDHGQQQTGSYLTAADPAQHSDARARALVTQMAADARRTIVEREPSASTPWWKRRAAVPMAIAGVAALTGSALLIPLTLSVSGSRVEPDVQIAIDYTTASGIEVQCRYQLFVGEPGDRDPETLELAAFLAAHDWTGIGQRIYEQAVADPMPTGRAPILDPDAQPQYDEPSFSRATFRVIESEIPPELRSPLTREGGGYSAVTDCRGDMR